MVKKLKFTIPRILIDSKDQPGEKIILLEENSVVVGSILFTYDKGENFEGVLILAPDEKEMIILKTVKHFITESKGPLEK